MKTIGVRKECGFEGGVGNQITCAIETIQAGKCLSSITPSFRLK